MAPFVSRLNAGILTLCTAAFVLAATLVAPVLLDGSDLYWHIATGRWMLENHAVLRIDPFSLSFAGHAWQTQDWLSEVVLALTYIGAGWSAVLALGAAVAAFAAGQLGWSLARRGPALLVVLVLALATAADALTISPFLLSLPLAMAWTAGLVRARRDHRAPALGLFIVMVLWANLNASFLAGLAVMLVLAAEAVFEERGARASALRGWGMFTAATLIAALITPYGAEGLLHAVRHMELLQSEKVQSLSPLLLVLPAAIVMIQRRVAMCPFRLALLAVMAVCALLDTSSRLLFAFTGPLLLADAVAAAFSQQGLAPRTSLRPVAGFILLSIVAIAVRLAIPVARGDGPATPAAAFAVVPATLAHSPVLNEEAFGGFLIFHDVRPYIDDRLLYSDAFRGRYARLQRPDGAVLTAILTRHRIRWTIFSPGNPVVAAMDGLAGWHRLYADRWAVVHVKNGVP